MKYKLTIEFESESETPLTDDELSEIREDFAWRLQGYVTPGLKGLIRSSMILNLPEEIKN